MTFRFLFALVILVIYLKITPAKKIHECLKEASVRRNQSENVAIFWKDDIPLKLGSPFMETTTGSLSDSIQTIEDVLAEVLICNSDSNHRTEKYLFATKSSRLGWNKKPFFLNPGLRVLGKVDQLRNFIEERGPYRLMMLADCLKSLEAGERNWMKDTCPDYDYAISPNLTDLEGSCRKDSQNLRCMLDNLPETCGQFIVDVYVLKNRVAYTLLEIHYNENDEEYPEQCHSLAMGSGVIGRNPRGNMSTWTLIYLALLSWAVQSAVGMIEKFGR